MKKIAVTFIFALSCITINAQIDQIFKPIILQLEESNGIKEYVVNNYSHSMALYDDSVRSVSISLTLDSFLDDYLVKWIADPQMEKKGKVLIKNRKTGVIISEYSFKGAKISSFSESHYNSSYSTYEQESNINLVLSFKEYTINGTELKQIKSYSY